MSYTGLTKRTWRLARKLTSWPNVWVNVACWVFVAPLVIGLDLAAWACITIWYCAFGVCLVPYRLLRRGDRNRKREKLQHREMLDAISRQR
jgi:Flp pilus assembly protein TadB